MAGFSVRGGHVFDGVRFVDAGVRVEGGRVAEVGDIPAGGPEVDARGLWVLPGAIDAHVHSRDPGFPSKEDWTSLTRAAAAGGVTVVVDMPNTVPATDSAGLLAAKAELAAGRAVVDFGLWGLLRRGSDAATLGALAGSGAAGFKAYLGYSYDPRTRAVSYDPGGRDPAVEAPPDYADLAGLAPVVSALGLPLAVHCEDAGILRESARRLESYADVLAARPDSAEAEAVERVAEVARVHGVRLHVVHVSSELGLQAALAARAAGADLSVETCPQYLFATADDYERVGNALRMNPPVRTAADRAALRAAVAAGDVDILATDHAPHTDAEKFGVPLDGCHPGSPGVQVLLLAALQLGREVGQPERVLGMVTSRVAGRLGFEAKGRVAPGADADLVLVDPAGTTRVEAGAMLSRQRHGVLEGFEAGFAIRAVYSRGELVFDGADVIATPGRGRLVRPGRP